MSRLAVILPYDENHVKNFTNHFKQETLERILKLRKWKSYGIVGITSAIGMAIFVLGLLFAMFPRSASDNPVMTLTNAENVTKEITKFG